MVAGRSELVRMTQIVLVAGNRGGRAARGAKRPGAVSRLPDGVSTARFSYAAGVPDAGLRRSHGCASRNALACSVNRITE